MGGYVRGIEVFFIVPRNITWLLGPFEFQRVLSNNRLLDHVSARLIDRVGDVRIEFVRSTFDVAKVLRASQTRTALIAVMAAKMVFRPAAAAASGHLATRHRDKWTVGPFDDLQIADHKAMIERDGAEGTEAIFRFLHELDSNLGNFHGFHCTPLASYDQFMSLISTFRSVLGWTGTTKSKPCRPAYRETSVTHSLSSRLLHGCGTSKIWLNRYH